MVAVTRFLSILKSKGNKDMKARLHVAKKFDVQWGDHASFANNHIKEFILLARLCNVNYSGDVYYDIIAIDQESYRRMIDKLKHTERFSEREMNMLNSILEDGRSSVGELVECLEKYLEEADLSDGYLHFRFF